MKQGNVFLKKGYFILLVLSLLMMAGFMPRQVQAASQTGSITIQLKDIERSKDGVAFNIYPVGEWDAAKGNWKLDSKLADTGVILSELNGASEWQAAAQKLSKQTALETLAYQSGKTDANGELRISDLAWAMYLIVQTDTGRYGTVDPFLVSLPYVTNGAQECNRVVSPKALALSTLQDSEVTLSETSYIYDGTEKKPEVTVILNGKTLVKDKDYTVSYKNNKKIGTATVTISGIGNFSETVSTTFTIQAKKGTAFNYGKNKYKVTGAATVAFTGIKSAKTTSVTIPATVKYGGKTFKVTSIAGKALKNKTKVKKVTIGKNVNSIGGSAFYGCKKLKTITIKSTVLKKAGKNAFKGISKKAVIKVPKSKLSSYKKLLKKKGQGTEVKIKKK